MWGLALGLGIVLCVSPVLWPPERRRGRPASTLTLRARESLTAAGLPRTTPGVVGAISVFLGALSAGVSLVVVPVPALAAVAFVLGAVVPAGTIARRAAAQRHARRASWPDVVDHLVSAVRSGTALPEGVVALASSGPAALRPAFAVFEREYRLSGNLSASLDRLKAELVDPTADRIIETLRMSRDVGGASLPAVLVSLGDYLREEAAVRSEVEARQSWTVNAARLGVSAPWVVLLLLFTRPEAAAAYRSPGGGVLIASALGVSLLAYRLMLRVGRLPLERRWFR
nr:type II secretion system F family protein [Galbitalea soli]